MTAAGTEFMDQACCVAFDPELFAGERPDLTALAKRICADCPVKGACLEYAVGRRLDGVYGGVLMAKGRQATPGRRGSPMRVVCAARGCRKTFLPVVAYGGEQKYCTPACQVAESRARNRRHNALRRRVEVGEGRPPQKALLPNRTTS